MRIAVVGTGAVGGYFGGRLAESGEDVVFIARGATLEALRSDGLRVASEEDECFVIQPAEATDEPGDVGPVDVVVLGVKAWQVPEAARGMKPLIGSATCVLPLQNGVDAPAQLADVLGAEHALGGVAKILARVDAPAQIHHMGLRPAISFGELDDSPSDRVLALKELLERAQIEADIPDSIQAAMWEKFMLICAASGVGAVTRMPMGTIRTVPETRQMLEGVIEEIRAVALARQIPVADDALGRIMKFFDSLPAGSTSSMQRDILARRPSELTAQNGAVVRLGEESGVDTPLNRFIYYSLIPAELEARDHEHQEGAIHAGS